MKKIYILLLSLLFSLALASCNANNSNSNNNSPQKHSMILTMYNYDEFINMNYTYTINGPQYGSYGFEVVYTVTITSLDNDYTFRNVEITFNHSSATKFKLSSSGNSTFTITDYKTVNSGTNKASIKSISGIVLW